MTDAREWSDEHPAAFLGGWTDGETLGEEEAVALALRE
jgi:hypothetical protein